MKYLGCCVLFATMWLTAANNADALPPPPSSGSFVSFRVPVVLCDTQEQVTAIFEAGKDNAIASRTKFEELRKTRNDKQEPACQFGRVQPVFVVENVDLGQFYNMPGEPKYQAWAVHVSSPRFEGWLLYAIPNTQLPAADHDGSFSET